MQALESLMMLERDLGELLEAFGHQFSLEDLASAYCQAKRDINVAAEILFSKDRSNLGTDMDASKNELKQADATSLKLSSKLENESEKAVELAADNALHKLYREERNTGALMSKSCSSSMGTVSGVIGKKYIRSKALRNDSWEPTKPVKIESKELPISETWSDKVPSSLMGKNNSILVSDVEEFLFKMLGDGFQLDMTRIHDIFGQCGYDMQKSMEKLIDLSASTLEKFDDVVDEPAAKITEKRPEQEFFLQQEHMIHLHCTQSDGARSIRRNLIESPKRNKDRSGLQKEVLESLFVLPERSEEAPKRTYVVRSRRGPRASGKVVVEPDKDTLKEHNIAAAEPQEDNRDVEGEDDENNYEVLRKAVKEYWVMMKEYYEAAVDAFVKGDHARANKLLQQGHFFKQKAREADGKSAEKLVETREDEVVSFDWHAAKPKEAVRLLKVHLPSISGIPGIKYTRVILATHDEDITKEARKRMITTQLEKESIKWTEEENGLAILIEVDTIDPQRLSFAKRNNRQVKKSP